MRFTADQITVIRNITVLKYQDLHILVSNKKKISNFLPVEVVSRGSGTQLQVNFMLVKI